MTTAIVTGATGITGQAVVNELIKSSQYKKIYTLSRSQPGQTHEKVEHASLDLCGDANQMADSLKSVQGATQVFFCAYLANDDEGEAAKINSSMLQNFLDALHITGALKDIKRIILTCGLKQYGVHLGLPKQPMEETDPIHQGDNWPPNFYFSQQKVLIDNASKGQYKWTVTLPQDVLGYAKGNFMNECTALGLYCAVAKVAHPNSELPFPGSRINYLAFNCWTSANLHARFCLWAASAPNAENQIFNVTNGDTQSWQTLWPRIAMRFGCKIPQDQFHGGDRSTYRSFAAAGPRTLHDPPPIALQAESMGLPDLANHPSTLYQQIDTAKWSQRPEILRAWKTLRDKYNLDQTAWDKATWGFLTFVLGREYSCVVSMSKARKMGWNGYEDTWDSFEEVFSKLEEEGILPAISQLKGEKSLA